MNVLVLGGTLFLGRHVVTAAQVRGHRVTTFTRGRTNPAVHTGVETLRGDRDHDVRSLTGREFDLVIDTSAYQPRHVELVASALGVTGRYVLISSASVYPAAPVRGASEDAPAHEPLWDNDAAISGETYGPLKRACEEAARRAFGGRALILRPGLLIGPHDPTNRFSYWVRRIERGGEILAPGSPDRPIQLLDARDVAAWIFEGAAEQTGVFNLAGPDEALTFRSALSRCVEGVPPGARLTWVSDAFLLAHDVAPWTDLPLWLPAGAEPIPHLDTGRARRHGLSPRPLAESIRDILDDASSADPPATGALSRVQPLTLERERDLLVAWHQRPRVDAAQPGYD